MFGPPGHLYVYFTYGMHYCMNVVTGHEAEGSAVLLRAVEPLEGTDEMQRRRGTALSIKKLCSGPARLTQAFGVERQHNGVDLISGGDLYVAEGCPLEDASVSVGPRIGITVALDRPWRFFETRSEFVSRPTLPSKGEFHRSRG